MTLVGFGAFAALKRAVQRARDWDHRFDDTSNDEPTLFAGCRASTHSSFAAGAD
jgi:hypothetical protein